MKRLLIFLLFPVFSFAQVGIGTTNPNASLDIRSSNQATPANDDGLLIPKIDEFPATNPGGAQNGMLVFVTGNGAPSRGFYYWSNALTAWVPFTSIERINDLVDGKSDVDGTNDGSSIFLGLNAGRDDDSSHNKNIGIGYQALRDVVGADANDPDGQNNVAVGFQSLRLNSSGRQNVAMGSFTLDVNTTGFNNTAIGHNALTENIDGLRNTAIGSLTMINNTSGNNNTAIGGQSLSSNTTGNSNVAVGAFALSTNSEGLNNVTVGNQGLRFNNLGSGNVAIGDYAGRSLDDGNLSDNNNDYNVYIGSNAGNSDLDATQNVYIGYQAGAGDYNPESNSGTAENKSGNVFIGYQAGYNESNSERLYIENSNAGQNGALIYGQFDNERVRINGELQVRNPGATNGYAFPLIDGNADQVLVTDGNGQLTFEDQQTIPVVPDVSTFTLVTATLATGTDQVLGTGGWQKVAFSNETLNATMATGLIDATNNRFVADADGYYRITASFHTTNAQETNDYFGIAVRLNGSTTNYQEYSINHAYSGTPGTASQVARQISCVVQLDATEYAEIFVHNVFAGTGGAVTLDADANKTQFTIERIR